MMVRQHTIIKEHLETGNSYDLCIAKMRRGLASSIKRGVSELFKKVVEQLDGILANLDLMEAEPIKHKPSHLRAMSLFGKQLQNLKKEHREAMLSAGFAKSED
jgi:hypothetical protein